LKLFIFSPTRCHEEKDYNEDTATCKGRRVLIELSREFVLSICQRDQSEDGFPRQDNRSAIYSNRSFFLKGRMALFMVENGRTGLESIR
jgi:hypothetical protein